MKLQASSYRWEAPSVRSLGLCANTIDDERANHLPQANFAPKQTAAPGP